MPKENDVVRLNVKPVTLKEPVETFTMQFGNVKPNSCDLQLLWENTFISFAITTDIDTKVTAQINDIMNKDNRPYYNAAMYYMDNGKDLNLALTWFNKALEQYPNTFYMIYEKAVCQAKLGKKDDAKETALKGIESAKEAKNDDYVALNEKLIASLK